MNFDFLAHSYVKNRHGAQNGHKTTPTSKTSITDILIRKI